MKCVTILWLTVCLGLVQSVSAAQYYVATTGDDSGPGDKVAPWRTIQKAASTMQAGDVAFIRGGTYVELVSPVNSGTADNYITYRNLPGATVIIQSPSTPGTDYTIDLDSSRPLSYLKFIGLTLRGAYFANFNVQADVGGPKSHLVLDSLTCEGGGFGMLFDGRSSPGVTDVTITHCEVHGNGGGITGQGYYKRFLVENNHISNSSPFGGFPWGRHNLRFIGVGAPCEHITIRNNELHHAERQGISIWYTTRVLIQGNHSHHNGASGVQIESASGNTHTREIVIDGNLFEYNAQTFPAETGMWVDDATDVIVQNNISRYNEIGLKITGSERVLVRNNVLYENFDFEDPNAGGIQLREGEGDTIATKDVTIIHNTFHGNGGGSNRAQIQIGLADNLPDVERTLYRNNIATNCESPYDLWIQGATHALDYNNFFHAGRPLTVIWQLYILDWQEYLDASGYDRQSMNADPLYVDAAAGDYSLDRGSPCIDAGDYLTRTVSNGSGTTISVEQARYFTDGIGVMDGDLIVVGTSDTARVVAVDYLANILTIDRSLIWNGGDGVSYPYVGNLPDMGALEYDLIIIGDTNLDGVVTSADILVLVAYVFKGGAEPPFGTGDTNCDGETTSADVIELVSYVFKGGPSLCSSLERH